MRDQISLRILTFISQIISMHMWVCRTFSWQFAHLFGVRRINKPPRSRELHHQAIWSKQRQYIHWNNSCLTWIESTSPAEGDLVQGSTWRRPGSAGSGRRVPRWNAMSSGTCKEESMWLHRHVNRNLGRGNVQGLYWLVGGVGCIWNMSFKFMIYKDY